MFCDPRRKLDPFVIIRLVLYCYVKLPFKNCAIFPRNVCPYHSELSIHSHCWKGNFSKENTIDRIKRILRTITVSCFEDNGFSPEYLEHCKRANICHNLSPYKFPYSRPRNSSPKVLWGGKINSFQLPSTNTNVWVTGRRRSQWNKGRIRCLSSSRKE